MNRLVPVAIGLLGSLAWSQVQPASSLAPDLLTPIPNATDPVTHGIRRSQPVRVNVALLKHAKPGHVIRIKMFDDAVFHARLDDLEVERYVKNAFHWRGELVGRAGSTFVLTVCDGAFWGWLFPNDGKFQSLGITGVPGMYVARELEDRMHEGSVMVPPVKSHNPPLSVCNDDKNRWDVTLVYTTGAALAAGGTAQISAACLGALNQANTCLQRSSMSNRFIAKSVRATPYFTSGNQGTDLNRLTNKTDRIMDEVHGYRRTDNSDLVALVRRGGGGTAWCRSNWNWAFSVNGYDSLASMVLAHELGHNGGCGHDPANNTPGNRCINTSYGRGHNWLFEQVLLVKQYAYTVMSYSINWGSCSLPFVCVKTRQPNYSSPAVRLSYKGKLFPSGTSSRDNRRTLLLYAQDIANNSIFVSGRNQKPTITRQPSARNINLGYVAAGTVLMSCAANGYGNSLSYQWRKNGRSISGKTRSSLTLSTNLTAGDAGGYDCVITTCAGSVTTRRVTLSVGPARILRHNKAFGAVVASVGDFDGDCYEDVAAGEPKTNNANSWVTTISGKTHGLIDNWGRGGNEENGASLAGGDINGDGFSDVILGAPGWSSGRGQVRWRSGKDKLLRVFASGTVAGKRFGEHVTVANLDAAANPDVAISGKDRLEAWSSRVRRLWAVVPVAGVDIDSLSTVGDVNADGYEDLVIGLPTWSGNKGRWETRSGKDGSLLRSWGGSPGEQRGFAVTGIGGDVDGDKVPDFVSTSPPYTGRGLVQFWSGRTGLFIRSRWGPSGNKLWGRAVSAIGDYNGDGFVDVLVGAKGYCSVMSGRDTSILRTISSSNPDFAVDVAGVDTNGDCRPDIVVCERNKAIWVYDSAPKSDPPAFTRYGATCPGTGGRMPRIGKVGPHARIAGSITVTLDSARANSAAILKLAVFRDNQALDFIGMTGCFDLGKTTIVRFVTPTDARGHSRFRLPISSNPVFAGISLTWQWLILDQGGNRFGLTTSDGAEMKIGAK